MADVIDLTGRKKIRDDLEQTDRLEMLQSVLRCGACAMRCAKCGVHGEPTEPVTDPGPGTAFNLCPGCLKEYRELRVCLDGGDRGHLPSWYNREWVRQWLAWLEYRRAMNDYLESAEILAILSELRKK